jgi:hypothetical protein
MTSTVFVDGVTLTDDDWFNDVNRLHYTILNDPANVSDVLTALGTQPIKVCEGRLTLTSSTPVTTSDVTAAETIYFTPYKGDQVTLYDGTLWSQHTLTELSADVPDATQMNDVFIYSNAGTLTLDIVAWTNDTTRATVLTTQDGIYVKAGAVTRRYVGSFYSTTAGNGQTEDSVAKRYVWNYYNRVLRPMKVIEATATWTYAASPYRQVRATATNQLDLVIGVSEDIVKAVATQSARSADATERDFAAGIGLDSTTVNSAAIVMRGTLSNLFQVPSMAIYNTTIAVGKHSLVWLEAGVGGITGTFEGTSGNAKNGIIGEVWA